jgi:hypothetical protein
MSTRPSGQSLKIARRIHVVATGILLLLAAPARALIASNALDHNDEFEYYVCGDPSPAAPVSAPKVDVKIWPEQNAVEIMGNGRNDYVAFDTVDFVRHGLGEAATLHYQGQKYECLILEGE